MNAEADRFDAYALFSVLERQFVFYVLIGGLARVIQGSGEVTNGLDLCPSLKEDNLGRLAAALAELDARTAAGKPVVLERDLVGRSALALETAAGPLTIVPEPAGTQGYEDLRRRARNEPIGQGLRPQVAAVDDLARMLTVLNRDRDRELLRTMQRVIELRPEIRRGLDRGIDI